jgi:hypothetical protein
MPVTIAEMLVLLAIVGAIVWLLAPLRRWIRRRLERRFSRARYGEVIEARFRPVPKPPDEPPHH